MLQLLKDNFELSIGPVEDLRLLLREVDVFWFRLAYRLDQSVIDQDTRCKYLVSPVTGIDHIDEELCADRNIKIVCLRGETEFLKEVRATSEHTILLTQMLMRRSFHAMHDVLSYNWRRDLFRGYELYKKKVGIIGLGRLGSIVADYFIAFGCEVMYVDIDAMHTRTDVKQVSLSDLQAHAEIITIHIPLNAQTAGMIDESFFNNLKMSPYLINTSRGAIVKDEALIQALYSKEIAGAALDVINGEPNVQNNLLIDYAQKNDNLILTPHIGGNTYESFEKTEEFIAEKLIKHVSSD